MDKRRRPVLEAPEAQVLVARAEPEPAMPVMPVALRHNGLFPQPEEPVAPEGPEAVTSVPLPK